MRKTLSASLAIAGAYALTIVVGSAAGASALAAQDPPANNQTQVIPYTSDQLNNLVAPVALYADPLLAQVLLAATFPDQVTTAAQYVRDNGTNGIDEQYWDVSVKAVAHYPSVLNMMDQRIDWTTSLGQAYAQQSSDVMQSVQHMRELASAQGNLVNTPEQQVVYANNDISIWPAQPQYIYVPVYDPSAVFFRPVFMRPGFRSYFSFGIGYPIGSWLIYDWDWPGRRIVYTGWYGGGWIARSRPFISMNSIYVNAGYRNVQWGRDVISRRPDYGHVRVYGGIGRDVNFRDHDRGGRYDPNAGRYAVPRTGNGSVSPSGYHDSHEVVTDSHNNAWRSAPEPVHVRPQAADRPPVMMRPQVEPRSAQPRAPDAHVQYARPSAPAPQSHERSAPAPQSQSHGHSAPPPSSHGGQSGSRSAHHRGGI